jgi:Zn-dependent peptidase ImmA (M78 family)
LKEATEFLDTFHEEGTLPIPIDEIVEFDFEIALVPIEGIKDELSVDAFLTNDLTTIYIDAWVLHFVPTRLRFSLAHEIGHHWLHQDLYDSTRIASVADFRRAQEAIGPEEYRWLEWQANTFAGLILVPPHHLRFEYDHAVRRATAMGLTPAELGHHPARQRLITQLAGKFMVSDQTMEIRLERDGLLEPLAGGE